MVFRELQSLQRTLPVKIVAFERQRLLNLIDSKIKRREIENAIRFAEELFEKEVQYALIRRTRLLIKCNAMLWKIMILLFGGFFLFTLLTVLNINPYFSFTAGTAALGGIVSGLVVDRFLAKRLANVAEKIMEVYETRREAFVEKVLTIGPRYMDSEDWLKA